MKKYPKSLGPVEICQKILWIVKSLLFPSHNNHRSACFKGVPGPQPPFWMTRCMCLQDFRRFWSRGKLITIASCFFYILCNFPLLTVYWNSQFVASLLHLQVQIALLFSLQLSEQEEQEEDEEQQLPVYEVNISNNVWSLDLINMKWTLHENRGLTPLRCDKTVCWTHRDKVS